VKMGSAKASVASRSSAGEGRTAATGASGEQTNAIPLRLGVFMGQVYFRNGERITTEGAFHDFLAEVCGQFAGAHLLVPLRDGIVPAPYAVDRERLGLIPLPPLNQYSAPSVLLALPRTIVAFFRLRGRVDMLWIGGPHILGPLLVLLCRLTGLPFFLVIRQDLVELVRHKERGLKGRISTWAASVIEWYYRRVATRHLTLTVGQAMWRAYKERDPRAPVVPIVISMVREEVFASMAEATTRLQETTRPTLLAVGRLSREKGFDILLESVHRLVSEGRELTLDLVGEGPERGALEEQARRLGLEEVVTFSGYVPFGSDLFDHYRAATLFVLSSRSEGVPQVLLEAMACGTPIIATAIEAVPHIIEDGENGVLVPPEDPTALARRIGELLDDPSRAERLAEKGRAFVAEHTLERERDRIVATIERYWPNRLRGIEVGGTNI